MENEARARIYNDIYFISKINLAFLDLIYELGRVPKPVFATFCDIWYFLAYYSKQGSPESVKQQDKSKKLKISIFFVF